MQSKISKLKRFVSGLMAAIMLVGLMPSLTVSAEAADATPPDVITMSSCNLVGQYNSPNGLGSPWMHTFYFTINGQQQIGFCADHRLHMGDHSVGKEWQYNLTFGPRNNLLCIFLDYYYDLIRVSNEIDAQYPNASVSEKEAMDWKYVVSTNRQWLNAWIQAVCWFLWTRYDDFAALNQPDTPEGQAAIALLAKERDAAIAGTIGSQYVTGDSVDVITNVVKNWFAGKFEFRTYYKYYPIGNHDGYDDQPIYITMPDDVPSGEVWVKILKLDENGKGLSGAKFDVFWDAGMTSKAGTIETGSDGWGYLRIEGVAEGVDAQFWAKEISVPSPYKVRSGTYTATANSTANGSKDTAAPFNAGVGILNSPEPDDPNAIIKKIDARTGAGVGPAYIRFVGQADDSVGGYAVDTVLKTDSNGTLNIQWKNPNETATYVPPGQYTVTEDKAPDGYALSDEEYHLVLTWIPESNTYRHSGNIVFHDDPLRSVIIKKYSEDDVPLSGAVFEIYRDGQLLDTLETGQDGTITYAGSDGNGLAAGYYEFKEIVPPPGYLLPYDNIKGVPVYPWMVDDNDPIIVTFKDYRYPDIVIKKVAAGTDEPVAGATFEVQIDGETLGSSYVTGADGTIVIDYATYNKFLTDGSDSWTIGVREIGAPDGYLIDDDNWQTAELQQGETLKEFVFSDTKYPEIWVRKLDRETGEPLANASFNILIDGVDIGGPFVSDVNGWVKITYEDYKRFLNDFNDPLPYNGWTVTVTEITAPDKYNLDSQPLGIDETRQYTLTSKLAPQQSKVEFTFKDTSYRKVRVIKKDAETNWPLAGAEFTLESIDLDNGGSYKEFLTTDKTGTVLFEDVPNGTYKLWESKAPNGYANNSEVKTVIVKSADDPIVEYEFKNAPHSGIKFLKVDAATGTPIPGCLFDVTITTPDPEGVVGGTAVKKQYTTDENGLIVIENANPGTYIFEEISAPAPYRVDSTPQIINVNNEHDAYSFTMTDVADGILYIQKLDSVTHEPLAGAYFDIHTASGTFVAQVGPTDTSGFTSYAPLVPGGSYVVTEIKSPDSHIMDTTPQTFTVPADISGFVKSLIFDNAPTANLWLHKVDAQTGLGLQGAVFTIKKGNGEIVKQNAETDQGGYLKVNDLDPGIKNIGCCAKAEWPYFFAYFG